MVSTYSFTEFDTSRKRILSTILIILLVDVLVNVLAYPNTSAGMTSRNNVTNVEVTVTSAIAAASGLIVVARQGVSGLHGKTYFALAIGLAFWCLGELTWTYEEVILGNILPETSIADIFWLAGYPFLSFHLFKMYRYFAPVMDKSTVIPMAIIIGMIEVYLLVQIVGPADISTVDGTINSLIRIGYPIGDLIILLPAALLLLALRNAKLHFSPWFFISLSLIVTSAADMIFAYASLFDLPNIEWIPAPAYNFAYLIMAGGLYWYSRFAIFNTKTNKPDWKLF